MFQAHLHITLGRSDGSTLSGHVVGDLNIFSTAEVVLGHCPELRFDREHDQESILRNSISDE
jgi:predicted DNA-binding protein with PD1-like motif